jgi:iron complex outermembrane receptor protein
VRKVMSWLSLGLLQGLASGSLAQTEPPESKPINEILVEASRSTGGGLIAPTDATQSVSAVDRDYVADQVPTANAFQLIELLPGANVSTSDPYGISTSYSLKLRGLGQDEIGVLLDGAPQNDIGYFYAYPSQFIDAENIETVSLAQGSVDLDSPILNGVAGLLKVNSRDPEKTPDGLVDFTYGSYNLERGFVRLDTGLIPGTGLRAFLSYSDTGVDNWRGPGNDHKQHVDFKAVEEWGDGNRIAIAASYNDALTSGYPLVTLADWQALGRANNYDATFANQDPNYWKLYQNTFSDLYFSLPSSFTLAEGLSLNVTPYVQTGYGNSPYGTTLTTTGNYQGTELIPGAISLPNAKDGTATVMGDFTGDQFRAGAVFELAGHIDNHALIAGYWVDYDDDVDQEPFSGLSPEGSPSTIWAYPSSLIRLPNGQILYALNEHTISQAQALFLGDTATFLDEALTIEFGFKAVYSTRNGTNNLPGPQYAISYNDFEPLPRAAIRYRIDATSQIFANVTTNFRAPNEYDFYDEYYDGTAYQVPSGRLSPERSTSEELGYRYADPTLTAAITAFNYDFSNRQIATVIDQNGAQVNATVNGGGQTSRGVDAEIGLAPIDGFSPYVSAEFLDAHTTSDIPDGGDLLPTKGKVAVNSPKFQVATGITYKSDGWFGSVSGKYTAQEYATFVNDERIPGHGELDAAIGYRFAGEGPVSHPEIRLNLLNLTDEKVLSGVASTSTNANTVVGLHGTVIAGAPPTYYIGPGFAASVTVTAGF